jgi:ABC-type lipoprotein release transport system permease subunit
MRTIWRDLRYSARLLRQHPGFTLTAVAILLGWSLRVAIYQINPLDPVTLGGATGILAIASLAASIIPARRAADVLPMTALRNG